MIYDESYGTLSFAQRAAYRKNNVPPALHDELVDYFGTNHAAITAYAKAKGSSICYGDVFRDRPSIKTGKVNA